MSLQYVLDGYNIINHPSFLRIKKHFPSDPALELPIFIKTNRLTGSNKNTLIIVFDGYPLQQRSMNRDLSGIEGSCVIFSRRLSADNKIKNIVEESGNRKNIVVVSDDKEINFIVKALGARCISVEDFLKVEKKKPQDSLRQDGSSETKLNYTQSHKINEELKRIWLK